MEFLKENFLYPLGHRVGTLTGTFLGAQGVDGDTQSQLKSALVIILGVVLDIVLRRFQKKGAKD